MTVSFKDKLKRFVPPSSKTVNARLSYIEQQLANLAALYKNNNVNRNDRNNTFHWDERAVGAQILYYSCWANHIHEVHKETFGPFKGCYRGKDIVILATGPSVKYFKPFHPAIYIGVNHAYKFSDIELDCLFIQDFQNKSIHLDEIKELPCIKFVGAHCCPPNIYVTAEAPLEISQLDGFRKYYVNHVLGPAGNTPLHIDLEYFPVMDCWSTTFSAIEFALYTHPSRIFLVGCDTGTQLGGHFDGTPHPNQWHEFEHMYRGYLQVKDFASAYYPDVEIISINPVRLKGMFKDRYTENFLLAHPDIEQG